MQTEEKIRLWTCQTPALFNMVMENGVAYCNQESWLYNDYTEAYKILEKERKNSERFLKEALNIRNSD